MATPISTTIKFNGVVEITLTPTEPKDKELLGIAVRGNSAKNIVVAENGAITFILAPTESV